MFWNKKPDPRPFGIPLDGLEISLKAGNMKTERDGNALIARQNGITTRISVDQPKDRQTEDGMIQAVVTIRNELPAELAPFLGKSEAISAFNPMTTIGALMVERGKPVIGSRITVYEGENAWDLQVHLVMAAALVSAQTMMGAVRRVLTGEGSNSDQDTSSSWTDDDMDEVQGYLSKMSVCTAGGGGLTAEFGLRSGNLSAAQGDHYTALWKLNTEQPHPEAGGGLFCLLEMPHQIPDEAHLGLIVDKLNALEMSPLDLPPHIGAWCPGSLGNNPAYVTFLPNYLHDKQGLALNVSFWAVNRAQWANAMLASLGVRA